MLRTVILAAVIWSLGAALPPPGAAGQSDVKAGKPPYIFGVFPYLPPARLEELFAPNTKNFAEALDRELLFRTKKTFARWFEAVKAQEYDIVFIQPFHYVKAFDRYGYLPLARIGEPLSAVLMVRATSPLTDLGQLRGKTVALPPVEAAVSHLTKIALIETGLEPGRDVTVTHFKNHDSCLQQVVIGTADVCGTARVVVRNFIARRPAQLRELAVTPAIPHALYAVHARVSKQDRETIRRVILGWSETKSGRQWLMQAGFYPFVAVSDSEYDIVRDYAKFLNLPN